ncbi:unannotated protein [freshwater metagenome]|uniref:Unannotated protein n=1 Tax=freshwater metagenome TaxID=449393 RepID=A0A6J7GXR4_9ZZZZ
MWPVPMASSYSLPAKYGGEVTSNATELSATNSFVASNSRASPRMIRSRTLGEMTSWSSEMSGSTKRP